MRILHVFKTYLPDSTGGVEQVIFQLCESGIALGAMGEVLTLSTQATSSPVIQIAHHRVYRAQQDLCVASTGLSWRVFQEYQKLLDQADVVHFHFPWPMMDLLYFYSRPKCATLVSYHSDIVRQKLLLTLYRPLMHRFLNAVDAIVVASPNYQNSSPTLQRYLPKTHVIPFGLERSAYPTPSAERMRFWQNKLGDTPFFLFVGVLRYYKGLHTALEALQHTSYPFVIVGSGPQEEALKQQAHRLGLTQQVQFLGRLDDEDKVCLLQRCHAFVFPSHLRSEAFGMSLLEAAMYGKPMISCEIGTGTSFINQDQVTGLVIPPEQPNALRAALKRLWEDPEYAALLGQNAQHRFEQKFTAHQMCQGFTQLYQQLIEQHLRT